MFAKQKKKKEAMNYYWRVSGSGPNCFQALGSSPGLLQGPILGTVTCRSGWRASETQTLVLRLELVSEFKFKLPHVTAAANDVVVICLAGLAADGAPP